MDEKIMTRIEVNINSLKSLNTMVANKSGKFNEKKKFRTE